MLCSNDRCVSSIVGPSSYSQNATAIVFIEADLDWFETFTVELSYLDDDNQMVVKHSISDYDAGAGIDLIELFGIVFVIGVVIVWYRYRNAPRF